MSFGSGTEACPSSPARTHYMARKETKRTPVRYSFLAFDCENDTTTGKMICAAVFGIIRARVPGKREDITIQGYYETEEELQRAILEIEEKYSRKYYVNHYHRLKIVGFNTAYDLPYIMNITDTACRFDAGSRFIRTRTKKGTKIVDVSAVFSGTLEDAIRIFGFDEKYGLHKRTEYLNSDEGKRIQVLDDAKATFYLAEHLQTFFVERFNIPYPNTIAGAALRAFERNFMPKDVILQRRPNEQWKNDFERKAFRGGRVEVFQRGELRVQSYDVNSMYPSIMKNIQIPNVSKTKYLGKEKSDEIIQRINAGEVLCVECTVHVDEDEYIGPLPYTTEPEGKLIFPVGTFKGVWTSVELKNAIDYGKTTILDVERALYYPEVFPMFREYATTMMEERAKARKEGNETLAFMYKLMGNSLFGKFGERHRKTYRYVKEEDYDGNYENVSLIPRVEGFEEFTDEESAKAPMWVVIEEPEGGDARHTFPIIPALITAYARVKLYHALKANAEGVVYCDTDSIKVRGGVNGITIGKEPGQWNYEYEAVETFYTPKFYGKKGYDDEGRIKMKVKGVPKRARIISEDNESIQFEWEAPLKYRESIIRGASHQNVWLTREKSVSKIDNKREWYGAMSKPIRLHIHA